MIRNTSFYCVCYSLQIECRLNGFDGCLLGWLVTAIGLFSPLHAPTPNLLLSRERSVRVHRSDLVSVWENVRRNNRRFCTRQLTTIIAIIEPFISAAHTHSWRRVIYEYIHIQNTDSQSVSYIVWALREERDSFILPSQWVRRK